QIDNLRKTFDMLGEKPEETTCPAAEGLMQEHEELKTENAPQAVLEIGNLAGAGKIEHYELASYTMLAQMARDIGEKEAEELLRENLQQEKEMARTVEKLSRRLGKDAKKQMKEHEQAADKPADHFSVDGDGPAARPRFVQEEWTCERRD